MVEEVDEEGLSTSRYLGDIRIHHLTRGSIQTTMIGEAFSVVAKAILDAIPRFEVLQMMMMMKAVWSSLQKRKRKLNFHNNLLLPLPRGLPRDRVALLPPLCRKGVKLSLSQNSISDIIWKLCYEISNGQTILSGYNCFELSVLLLYTKLISIDNDLT